MMPEPLHPGDPQPCDLYGLDEDCIRICGIDGKTFEFNFMNGPEWYPEHWQILSQPCYYRALDRASNEPFYCIPCKKKAGVDHLRSDKHKMQLRRYGAEHKSDYRAALQAEDFPPPTDGRYKRDRYGNIDHDNGSPPLFLGGAPPVALPPHMTGGGGFGGVSVIGGASTVMPSDSISNIGGPAPAGPPSTLTPPSVLSSSFGFAGNSVPHSSAISTLGGFSSACSAVSMISRATMPLPGQYDPNYGATVDLDDIDWTNPDDVFRKVAPIDCHGREIPVSDFYYNDPQFDDLCMKYVKEVFFHPELYELFLDAARGWPALRCRPCREHAGKPPTKINERHTPESNTHLASMKMVRSGDFKVDCLEGLPPPLPGGGLPPPLAPHELQPGRHFSKNVSPKQFVPRLQGFIFADLGASAPSATPAPPPPAPTATSAPAPTATPAPALPAPQFHLVQPQIVPAPAPTIVTSTSPYASFNPAKSSIPAGGLPQHLQETPSTVSEAADAVPSQSECASCVRMGLPDSRGKFMPEDCMQLCENAICIGHLHALTFPENFGDQVVFCNACGEEIPPFPGAEIHPHLRSAHHQEMMTKFDPMGEKAVTWQVEYGFQATLTLLGTFSTNSLDCPKWLTVETGGDHVEEDTIDVQGGKPEGEGEQMHQSPLSNDKATATKYGGNSPGGRGGGWSSGWGRGGWSNDAKQDAWKSGGC